MSAHTQTDAAASSNLWFECRACLEKTPKQMISQDIFMPWESKGSMEKVTTLAAEITKLANVEVSEMYGYPRHLCQQCLKRLKMSLMFIEDVKTSEVTLKNRLLTNKQASPDKIWTKPIQLDKTLNAEILRNSMDEEIKQEVISDDEFGDVTIGDDNRDDVMDELNIRTEEEITEQPHIQVTVNDSSATQVKHLEDTDPLLCTTESSDICPHYKRLIDLDKDIDFKISSEVLAKKKSRKNKRDHQKSKLITGTDKAQHNFKNKKEDELKVNFKGNLQNTIFKRELRVNLKRIDNVYCQSPVDTICALPKTYTMRKRTTKEIIKSLGPSCNCKNNCSRKITPHQRQNVYNYYSRLKSVAKQRSFIINFTSKEHKPKKPLHAKVNKNVTFKYYLPVTPGDIWFSKKVRVCKTMFVNTVTCVKNIERVCERYESRNMVDSKGRYKQKMDTDIVRSVCEHFKHLQYEKLKLLKNISSGLQEAPAQKLSFNRMYNLYKIWVASTSYNKTARTLADYRNVILKYIPRDHIQTLQQGTSLNIGKKQKSTLKVNSQLNSKTINDDVFLLLVKNENFDEAKDEILTHSNLDVDIKCQSNDMIHIEGDSKDEKFIHKLMTSITENREQSLFGTENYGIKDIDYNSHNEIYSDSEESNFDESFKEDTKEKSINGRRKEEQTVSKTLQESDSSSNRGSWYEDFDDKRKKAGVIPNACTTSKLNSKIDENFCEDIKDEPHSIQCLFTNKRKAPVRDPAVIRHHHKYHGLAYETNSGRIIPKKVLGPPCTCRRGCAAKISQAQRQLIFDYFWSLGNKKKQFWFIKLITIRTYTCTYTVGAKNREYSLKYYLPTTTNLGNICEKQRVCTKMFFNTLACSSLLAMRAWREQDKNIQDIVKKQEVTNTDTKLLDVMSGSQSELQNTEVSLRNSRPQPVQSQDNTAIDFVYRAMPFEEYMAHFETKSNLNANEHDLKYENESHKKKKRIKKQISTINRNNGKRYISKRGTIVGERIMGLACNCTKACFKKFTEEQRRFLFQYYWALGSVCKQRAFLVRFSTREPPKLRLRFSVSSKVREQQYKYYLPTTRDFDGEKSSVCFTMFCNTLCASRRYLKTAWKNYEQGHFSEKRGKHSNRIKIRNADKYESVKDHYNFLQQKDPELKAYKQYTKQYPQGSYQVLKMFKLYSKWFDPSIYSGKAENFKQYCYVWYKLKKSGFQDL